MEKYFLLRSLAKLPAFFLEGRFFSLIDQEVGVDGVYLSWDKVSERGCDPGSFFLARRGLH